MTKVIKLKKGFDIKIQGCAEKVLNTSITPRTYAIKPTDFRLLSPIPKLTVNIGSEVRAGDPLFYDKERPEILYTAPVSGEVVEIKRGEKRRIEEVVILSDNRFEYKEFRKANPNDLSREEIIQQLLESGLWPMLRQRPFGITADPQIQPRDIFISCFDTAPLAPDLDFIVHGKGEFFQAGIDALRKLTSGKVHLGLNAATAHSHVFTNSKGVEFHHFQGPHPIGNVGIQIHHIAPIRGKNDIVWYVSVSDVLIIGKLFVEGRVNMERAVAVAGSEVRHPCYFKVHLGANVQPLLADNLKTNHVRVISGNVLTGKKIAADGHLGFYDNLISVIQEGDFYEFMGWLMPQYRKPTKSLSFFSGWLALLGLEREHRVNTNMHGEERPFVVTGQYESVLPMDLYPQHLIKAILCKDFDQMEGLGIYEVVEEDLALCEFVCTSKIPVQAILRQGLDLIREEG